MSTYLFHRKFPFSSETVTPTTAYLAFFWISIMSPFFTLYAPSSSILLLYMRWAHAVRCTIPIALLSRTKFIGCLLFVRKSQPLWKMCGKITMNIEHNVSHSVSIFGGVIYPPHHIVKNRLARNVANGLLRVS